MATRNSLKVTTTATINTFPEGIKPTDVNRVITAFSERNSVHVARTRAIGGLVAKGMSVRGIVALITAYTGGATPSGFSKSSVGRYALVHGVTVREDVTGALAEATPAEIADVIAGLYRIAGPGGSAAEVARAGDLIGKAKNVSDALVAVGVVKGDVARAAVAEVTATPNRPVAGEAADGGKQSTPDADDDADDTPANVKSKSDASDSIRAASVGTLIAALIVKVNARGWTPDSVTVEAFDTLASAFEARAAVVSEAAVDTAE